MSKILSTMIAAAFAATTLTAVAQTTPAPAAKAVAPAKASAKAAARKKPLRSTPELVQCLQPDRRVSVDINGSLPAKPKPDAKPGAKPGRPEFVALKASLQGNIAWDPKSPVLKAEGMKEIDKLVGQFSKRGRGGSDTRPLTVSAVVISGHSDVLEVGKNSKDRSLSEARAKAVAEYLVNKGVDRGLMFWEGRGASAPVPVTKFCFP